MAFTYSGNPGQSPRDAVRFAIGDTDERRPQLQDGEVDFCLTQASGNVQTAAVIACQAVITQLCRMCDQTVGSVSKSFSQLLGNYQSVLANLRRASANNGGMPFIGGISLSANRLPYSNSDYNPPQFTTRMMHGRKSNYGAPLLGELPGVGNIVSDNGET